MQNSSIRETESTWVASPSPHPGKGDGEWLLCEYSISFKGDENIFGGYITLCLNVEMCLKCHLIVYFKWLLLGELYHILKILRKLGSFALCTKEV